MNFENDKFWESATIVSQRWIEERLTDLSYTKNGIYYSWSLVNGRWELQEEREIQGREPSSSPKRHGGE